MNNNHTPSGDKFYPEPYGVFRFPVLQNLTINVFPFRFSFEEAKAPYLARDIFNNV